MWLLHSRELRLEAFFDAAIPGYAILSHRWGDNEVSFQELQAAIEGTANDLVVDFVDVRFLKIQKTRELARVQSIDWVWIDTCCIDKKSSAELSEAINSMFIWYKNSKVCYVYMVDVTCSHLDILEEDLRHAVLVDDDGSFKRSDWFSRGWTLQELLAPGEVMFYNHEWVFIDTRLRLADQISAWTGIKVRALEEAWDRLEEPCIAEKMSWASGRHTTRVEDTAYCLLGLFGVNMPLLYGEGARAFMRLQLEIIKASNDESIFAWRRSGVKATWERLQEGTFVWDEMRKARNEKRRSEITYGSSKFQLHSGLLAQEPHDFSLSGDVRWTRGRTFVRRLPYDMTNQGLRFYVDAPLSGIRRPILDLVLNCYASEGDKNKPVIITLKSEGDEYLQFWRRRDCKVFEGHSEEGLYPMEEQIQTVLFIRQDL